jgi:DNA-binding HxlR family transcriptional regulator
MLNRTYENQVCSMARTLEVVGERWTLLVLRDAFLGARRFDEFVERLGVARNVLTSRLNLLVDHGILERVPYQARPARFEYRPTAKGQELLVIIMGLMHWGDRHLGGPDGPPRLTEHRGCGGAVEERLVCASCGQTLAPGQIDVRPGPGLRGQQGELAHQH